MKWPKRLRKRQIEDQAQRLVEETEAYLNGDYLELARVDAVAVPPWVHFNWLAHTSPQGLVRKTSGLDAEHPTDGTWEWVDAELAAEIVALSGADLEAIHALQRDCLIPVEFMMSRFVNVDPAKILPSLVDLIRSHR
jgi:hypothetical protein